jgi:hypothetical protein
MTGPTLLSDGRGIRTISVIGACWITWVWRSWNRGMMRLRKTTMAVRTLGTKSIRRHDKKKNG